MFKKILIGYDGFEGSLLALEKGLVLAETLGAEVLVISVAKVPEYAEMISEVEEAKEQALKYYGEVLKDVERLSKDKNIKITSMIKYGKPAEIIVNMAEESGVDLIILGPSKYSYVRRRVLGSTADKVVERAPCSVLIIK
ncbi:universal stress protein [Thermodesulfobacterium sp. TA1]|uniref:universal stress protein n=1 Tax=Thermodesulfobacterium sp. TA1 TaxID=2234087 RepID=UPI00143DB0EA|nr:universal stress protein [Thermodesulfobacterium sp. TA1]